MSPQIYKIISQGYSIPSCAYNHITLLLSDLLEGIEQLGSLGRQHWQTEAAHGREEVGTHSGGQCPDRSGSGENAVESDRLGWGGR